MSDIDNEEEKYVLTPEAVLYTIVKDWGLNDEWNFKHYHVALEELMEGLVNCGYLGKRDSEEEGV